MKKPSFVFVVSAIILISAVALAFFMFYKGPAQRTVNSFLDNLSTGNLAGCRYYLDDTLDDHAFLSLFTKKSLFTGYTVLNQEKYHSSRIKVWVSLKMREGKVKVPIITGKESGRWLIVSLPRTLDIDAALPLSLEGKSSDGTVYKLDISGSILECTSPAAAEEIPIGKPVSLTLLEDNIVDFTPLIPVETTKIMWASSHQIEDIYLGKLPVSENLAIYERVDDGFEYLEDFKIPVGLRNVTLYHPPNAPGLVAVLNRRDFPINTIRVVLNDTDFTGPMHSTLEVTCQQPFTVETLVDPVVYSFEKGDKILFSVETGETVLSVNGNKLYSSPHRFYIKSADGSPVDITTIKRSFSKALSSTPYRGTIEVANNGENLIIVNELPLEEYLYSVVPSEMPVRFGLEALKVQAVAARSYAMRCLSSTGFAALGGHVDDSTSSQVYNNVSEQPTTVQAVEETRGMVPVYEGQLVDARFFSTSWGYTANSHEVWSDADGQFPGREVPYLVARPQYPGDVPSLHNEENFRAFLKQADLPGYDRFSPYFRWSLSMSREQLEAVINTNLPLLQKSQPDFILTRGTDGNFHKAEIPEDKAILQNLEVLRRGEGGNIMELGITTSSGVFKVIKELNIRRVLQPVNLLKDGNAVQLKCHDNTIIDDFPILPSAFASTDVSRDSTGNLTHVDITGGGFGHGVGMSQYGVYGLTLLGKSYEEIIRHYYPGCKLERWR